MSEFTNRKAGKAFTSDPTVAPVAMMDAMEFLGLSGSSDPLLAALLVAATDAVVSFTGRDLIERDWTLTHWDWPSYGTLSARNVGRPTGADAREIALPYATQATVASVASYGDPVTDFVVRGDSIVVLGASQDGNNDEPALVVEYTAGFGPSAEDVPSAIRHAIIMLAAWMYEHRGACDAMDGINKSGAAWMLIPWRKAELLI
jgi:hypothetical protein